MDERSSLLGQLRIDRSDRVETSHRRWVWWVAAAVVLVGIGLAAWFTWGARQGVPVSVVTAELLPTDVAVGPGSILDASGYVVARRKATVSSKITGKVVEVLIEEGQRVETNEIVARLDDTNARASMAQALAQREQSRANFTAAQVAFENAVPTFQRNEQQFVRAVISAQTFDTAKANYDAARTSLDVAARAVDVAEANLMLAQRNLDDTIVRAPFAGVITVKAAQEGEMVSPVSAGGGFTRTGIGTVVDMDSLEVEVDVSENFINRVRPDQAVTVKLNAYPDWEIAARVIAIIPTADRAKATVKVRVGFDAKDQRILPEMGARVAFLNDAPPSDATGSTTTAARAAQRAVVIPTEAVQGSGETGVVFVIADDLVERRTVRLGARTAAGQIVISGLASGARLAVGDFSQLTDGTRVRVEN
ncbi:MAG TPA: efflux RND transporter periplasmic adaptor subunit [Gammaproteobacteria bacterium]|nr:efflux RND transporter periplasmic adaptor subunit [Gammaproteobacteria bacterium]